MGPWEKLGRTVGLLALVATLTAASSGSAPIPLSDGFTRQAAGPPAAAAVQASLSDPADSSNPPEEPLDSSQRSLAPGNGEASAGSGRGAGTPSALSAPEDTRPVIVTHIVGAGETLTAIAARYGVSVKTVASSPEVVNPNRIHPGDRLVFPSVEGLVHVVKAGDTLAALAGLYEVPPEDIAEANAISDPKSLTVGLPLIVPGGVRPVKVATSASVASSGRTASSGRPSASGGSLSWPLRGQITSPYGTRWGSLHAGVDIAGGYGAIIRAAAPGKVVFCGWFGGYGRCIIIDHGDRMSTLYGHAQALLVSLGQKVARGDAVAKVGSSGNSTGPHLHFEVRVDGVTINPLSYLGE